MSNNTLILPEAKTDGAKLIPKKQEILTAVGASWLAMDRYLSMAIIEANKPTLANCYPPSVAKAALNCAVIGLMPGDAMGHAYFIPFKNKRERGREEAQLIVGYRGYLDLAFRSGFLASSHPEVIVEGEEFELWNDETGSKMRHVLTSRFVGTTEAPTAGNIIGAYCIYRTKSGEGNVVSVTKQDLAKVAKRSGPWVEEFPAMCRKTAILRARKEWRVTLEFDQAAMLDECERAGESQPSLAGGIEGDGEPALSLGDLPAVEEEATRV